MVENTAKNILPCISEELKKHRRAVDITIGARVVKGITPHSETLEILEGYAGGCSSGVIDALVDDARL
ncbi:hypothetical protein [Bartonella sp. CB178]|uniref:hypothetical protein n=1 Tax=Bartonella sp. CB178 TaxID=3112255 RepID=UPI00300DDD02